MLQFTLGLGIGGREATERLLDLGICPLRHGAGGGLAIRCDLPTRNFDPGYPAGTRLAQDLRGSAGQLSNGSPGSSARCFASHISL
jgi:hypothetical protein